MSVGRISTYALNQITLKNASLVQENLADLQTQLSSGQKSQSFAGMASQTEQFLALEGKISSTNLYQENNKLLRSRIESTGNALGQLVDTGTDIKNLIDLRRNQVSANSLPFALQLQGLYQTVASQLNINSEGRYLFSGTRTDAQPVDPNTMPKLTNDGNLDTTYYAGSDQNILTKVDDGVDMTLNVRADAPAFQKLMKGIALAQQGDTENDDAKLAQAFDLVSDGVKGIIDLQASVNANKVSLNQVDDRQSSLKLYWTGLKEEIGNADLVSVSTQVAINQGILQASFSSFAKINNLKLSDYLG